MFPSASVVDIYPQMCTEHEVQLLYSLVWAFTSSRPLDAIQLCLCWNGWPS